MQQAKNVLAVALVLSVGFALLSLLLPLTPSGQIYGWLIFHLDIATTILYATFYSIGALLFVLGLGAFKHQLRLAYIKLSAGAVLFGIAFAQLLVVGLLDLWLSPWVTSGAIVLPFIVAGFLMYLGVHSYAKIVAIKTIWARFSIVLPLVVVGVLASSILPHVPLAVAELEFDVNTGLQTAMALLIFAAAMLSLRIKQHTGAAYTNALAWLFMALVGTAATVVAVIVTNLLGFGTLPEGYLLMDFMLVISSALFIRAGYAFSKLSV